MIKDAESYRQGFISGLDIKENYKTIIFGFELNEILDILEKHLKEKQMTRAEAIKCFTKHMANPSGSSAERIIDFYVAAGMLEIKEDEEKPKLVRLTDDNIDVLVNIKVLIALLEHNGYVVNKCNGEG